MSSRHTRSTNIGEYFSLHIFQATSSGPSVSNPTVQATGAAAAGSVLPLGAYTIGYTFRNATAGSTMGATTLGTSTSATITTSVSNSQAILTGSVTLPASATNIDWYILSGPAGAITGFVGTITATGTFTINVQGNGVGPNIFNTTAARANLPQNQTAAIAAGCSEVMDYGHGTFLGPVLLGTTGTGMTLTLYNGNSGAQSSIISVITPTTNVTLAYDCIVENSVYYSYAGPTPGSVTLCALPVPV